MTIPSPGQVYSVGFGTQSQGVTTPVLAKRAPGANDIRYPIGKVWIDQATDQTWQLTNVSTSAGVTSATWVLLGVGSTDLEDLAADSGTATPSSGTITIAGGNSITTSATASTLTVALDAAVIGLTSITALAASDLTINSAAGQDIIFKMGDAAAANLISFKDSGSVQVAYINSDGTIGGVDLSTSGTLQEIGTSNTATTVSIGNGTGGNTISVGAGANTVAQIINLATGLSGADSTVNVLSGNGTAGTQTLNVLTGTRAGALNLATGAAAHVVQIGSTVGGGVSVAAGSAGILIGNNAECTTLDVGNVAATATRSINIGVGTVATAAVTDTIDIGGGGATTNADSIKTVDINTGVVAVGEVNTNIASGDVTSGTNAVSIQTGNVTAGTVTCDIATGTGTKTVSVGNADANTTVNVSGVVAVNASVNANVGINTGTSTGTVTIGNTLAGAIALSTSDAITLTSTSLGANRIFLSAATSAAGAAVNINAPSGSVQITGGAAVATAIDIIASGGGISLSSTSGVTVNNNLILSSVATQIQMNGGAATDFIGTGTLTAGVATIANTNIAATDRIFFERIAINGSTALGMFTYAITPATNFVLTSVQPGTPAATETNDTSTFQYVIIRQN